MEDFAKFWSVLPKLVSKSRLFHGRKKFVFENVDFGGVSFPTFYSMEDFEGPRSDRVHKGSIFCFYSMEDFSKKCFYSFFVCTEQTQKNDPLKSALSKQHSQTRTNIAHIFQMEHWVAAKKVRLAIKAAADALEMFDRRVTHEELVAICVRTTPSLLGKFLFVQCGRMVCLFLLLYVHSHGYSSEFGILV